MKRRQVLNLAASAAVASVGAGVAAPAWAAGRTYPDQPIRLLVGFPPGGATDVLARMVAQRLGARLNQSIVVDNQAGASGLLAAGNAAKARPDGYTLLFSSSTHATYPALYAKVPFDPVSSFQPIGLVATTPYVLVVHPSLPVRSMDELLAYARQHPGQLNYAGSSPGTAQHLGWELLKRAANVDMQYVPYKGSSDLLPDLKAGRLQAAIDNVAVMRPHIEDGSLRAIAVTGKTASAVLPGVPPISAVGGDLRDFEAVGWFGVFAPVGLAPDITQALTGELVASMRSDELKNRLLVLGAQAQDGSADALRQLLAREVQTWTPVIRNAGIKAG
jgi:tripartite-type tricarboxylate transporter receptor subunit TctC